MLVGINVLVSQSAGRAEGVLGFVMIDSINNTVLKPCPFCGGAGTPQKDRGDYIVWCNGCGAGGSFCYAKEDAIAAWNARANG